MYYLIYIAFLRIPFRSIPGTIPVSIPEWLHSAGINDARNGNFGRALCQNSIPPDSAGMTGFLRIPEGICGAG